MARPTGEPLGIKLARTAKVVNRAFDEALAEAGSSLPTWLILVALKGGQHAAQREMAKAIGIEGPTLTHHLNRMEAAGLVTRARDPRNRRVHVVALTPAGEAAFFGLLEVVKAFDGRLRAGVKSAETAVLGQLLDRLRANVIAPQTVAN